MCRGLGKANIIERYFEPETEFVYWRNESDLKRLMDDVSARPEPKGALMTPMHPYECDGWL